MGCELVIVSAPCSLLTDGSLTVYNHPTADVGGLSHVESTNPEHECKRQRQRLDKGLEIIIDDPIL